MGGSFNTVSYKRYFILTGYFVEAKLVEIIAAMAIKIDDTHKQLSKPYSW